MAIVATTMTTRGTHYYLTRASCNKHEQPFLLRLGISRLLDEDNTRQPERIRCRADLPGCAIACKFATALPQRRDGPAAVELADALKELVD